MLHLGRLVRGSGLRADASRADSHGPKRAGPGLAPNIAPAVGGVIEITGGALFGIGIGLIGGIVVMLLLCRFLVAALLRRSARFTSER